MRNPARFVALGISARTAAHAESPVNMKQTSPTAMTTHPPPSRLAETVCLRGVGGLLRACRQAGCGRSRHPGSGGRRISSWPS